MTSAILSWIALAALGYGMAELAKWSPHLGVLAGLLVGAVLGGLVARKMGDG